jgi:hypothetical protein
VNADDLDNGTSGTGGLNLDKQWPVA